MGNIAEAPMEGPAEEMPYGAVNNKAGTKRVNLLDESNSGKVGSHFDLKRLKD